MRPVILLACLALLAAACAPSPGGGPPTGRPPETGTAPSADPSSVESNAGPGAATPVSESAPNQDGREEAKVTKTNEQWRDILSPDQFYVLREKGTERAWTGQYDKVFTPGTYECVGCGQALFLSDHKYDSGCGWPAFYKPASDSSIVEHADRSSGMVRTEIVCSKCDGHLGHVFEDGPEPTGLRYCINSAVLRLVPSE